MNHAPFRASLLAAAAVGALVLTAIADGLPATPSADESAFLKESSAAMTKMMNAMSTQPTGDVDRDFVAMMVPHHQGAIDMAMIELRYGHNEQLRRIAQEIIVEQTQEIAAMQLAIGESTRSAQ